MVTDHVDEVPGAVKQGEQFLGPEFEPGDRRGVLPWWAARIPAGVGLNALSLRSAERVADAAMTLRATAADGRSKVARCESRMPRSGTPVDLALQVPVLTA